MASDRLAKGASAPEAAVRAAATDALGTVGSSVQAAPEDIAEALRSL